MREKREERVKELGRDQCFQISSPFNSFPFPFLFQAKTKLCERFIQYGDCPFGPNCSYAHGVKELQKTIMAEEKAAMYQRGEKNNPSYKTALCEAYMKGHYCQFADRCQYAHGKHELREKPKTKPEDLTEEAKQKLLKKNQQRPDYKTKMCVNIQKEGRCEFGDICNFAHSAEELRASKSGASSSYGGGGNYDDDDDESAGGSGDLAKNRHFKTVMCRNMGNCTFGDKCKFAHSIAELRNKEGGGSSANDSFQGYGGKNVMCAKMLLDGNCTKGPLCPYAHSPMELGRGSGGGGDVNPSHKKYKTTLCENWKNFGICDKGPSCAFAHGMSELRGPGPKGPMGGPPGPYGPRGPMPHPPYPPYQYPHGYGQRGGGGPQNQHNNPRYGL